VHDHMKKGNVESFSCPLL